MSLHLKAERVLIRVNYLIALQTFFFQVPLLDSFLVVYKEVIMKEVIDINGFLFGVLVTQLVLGETVYLLFSPYLLPFLLGHEKLKKAVLPFFYEDS